MLVAAAELLRERGSAGVTIDAVLARSGAPRGSVYHHFPGGRSEILREALQFASDDMLTTIAPGPDVSAVTLLRRLAAMWRSALVDSGFTAGSPVLAAAVGSGADEQQLASVAAGIFRQWSEASQQAFLREGFYADDARSLAHMTISSLEGAVVLCRATRSTQPLDDVCRQLEFLIKARAFVTRETATAR